MNSAGALLTFALSVALVVCLFFARPLIAVGEAELVVLERWRRFARVLKPGLNAFWPLLYRPRYVRWRRLVLQPAERADEEPHYQWITLQDCRLPLGTQWHAVSPQECVTRDDASVAVALQYSARLPESLARQAVYETDDPYTAAREDVERVLRAQVAQVSLAELQQPGFAALLMQALRERKQEWDAWGLRFCRLQMEPVDVLAPIPTTTNSTATQRHELERLENEHRIGLERARLLMLKELGFSEPVLAALVGAHNCYAGPSVKLVST